MAVQNNTEKLINRRKKKECKAIPPKEGKKSDFGFSNELNSEGNKGIQSKEILYKNSMCKNCV